MIVILLMLMNLNLSAIKASEFQPHKLKPTLDSSLTKGRTYNHYRKVRVIAPKAKKYPVLDQFESLLYPEKDFSKEHPGKRLERIEIAVLGDKLDNGLTIKERVNKVKSELISWQIANEMTLDILELPEYEKQNTASHAYISRLHKQDSLKQPATNNFIAQHYNATGLSPEEARELRQYLEDQEKQLQDQFTRQREELTQLENQQRGNRRARSQEQFTRNTGVPLLRRLGDETISRIFNKRNRFF